ncbi:MULTISPECIES: hypothetical protein [Rubrivivax]|uniref:hypothetical protein n=1 Tax=Rubrivivax TaxID=28067 RepID=UPI00020A3F7C|nr:MULTISPECIES: hypothetical protein [Rubrivivax]EGJ11945.1 hypothetical protein RBXJA2T_16522 [Rubrivivax benzoatilyticus JA2 = ATCC BAA-35]MCC9595879.1 hypothetical protein [Rubrivivax sp. JA1055]MCD0418140.1 hypothetical protein [Rubrivivax sp. JA1024]
MTQRFVLALALAAALPAMAQKAPAPASTAPAASATAPSSPAKKALVAKILQIQQPAIENMARQLAEQPALAMMQQAAMALQRLPAEQRTALAQGLQADAKKYADEAAPIVRDRAVKLAPSTVGAILEQRFSEEELKQLVTILESPVNRKFQSMNGDMQRALGEKLVAETKPLVEPKVRALEQAVRKRFEAITPAAAASAPK